MLLSVLNGKFIGARFECAGVKRAEELEPSLPLNGPNETALVSQVRAHAAALRGV